MFENQEVFKNIKSLKPAFFKRAFPKIFSWDELEHLLNLRPFINNRRLVITDLGEKTYSWERQSYMSDINTFPPSLLDDDILKNHVCYLYDSSRVNQYTNNIAFNIERTFPGSSTDAHIYFSVGDNLTEGFGIHMDTLYVLVVHVEGKSRLRIWDPSVTEEMGGDRIRVKELDYTPIIDEIMETGDAAFIPVNTYHCVTSLTKRLSVSFPITMVSETPPQDRHWIKLKI